MPIFVPVLLDDPSPGDPLPGETISTAYKATVPHRIRQNLLTAARRAATHEACGVLLGRQETHCVHIEAFVQADNVAASPQEAYEVSAEALLAAHNRGTVIGVFHSHPHGKAQPSATDRALGQVGWIYLISGTDGLRGFMALEDETS
ncbi:MAG: M67 family metallopeptidase [Clostridia bacterium]|nr:M67 family metallopeptidase [Deltaproteobacteria bacterium]